MMLKVADGYLDFAGEIEIERKAKLFEDISTADGDVSFAFDLDRTANNLLLLGIPLPDTSTKQVYQKIECDILDDEGISIYSGYLSIERMDKYVISVAFFAGNSNWFGMLSGPLSDIDFSEYDQEQNLSNIIASHSNDSGLVFPVMDHSQLERRGYRHMKIEDFVPGLYVKSVFKKIFQHHSIKIQGELLDDPTYNASLTLKNGKSQEDIDASSIYVGRTTTVSRPGENVNYKVIFDEDTLYPFSQGSLNIYDPVTGIVTMPYKMRFDIEVILQPEIVHASYNNRIWLYINGVFTFVDIGLASGTGGLYNSGTAGSEELFKLTREITLDAGDTLEVYTSWQQSTGSTQNDVLSGSMRITPKYIYSVFGNAIVPKWTQAEYVSNIMRMFNVITSYDNKTATLTLNLFDRLAFKTPIDVSDSIDNPVIDYKEFISAYGKRSLFSYNDVDFEDLRKYNVMNSFKYSEGVVNVDNDFIEDEADVIQSDFSNPLDYLNNIFGFSMTKTNLLTLEEGQAYDITSVTDSSGIARFNLAENEIMDGDLVRITDSDNPNYNGDWIVEDKGTGYLELDGITFDTDATATIRKLDYNYNDTDTVFIVWNTGFYFVSEYSQFANFELEFTTRVTASFGFFSLLNTDNQCNIDFKQSLSFGAISNSLFYQRTLLDTYWRLFARIVNDPVKLIVDAHMSKVLFDSIDFLRPVTVRHEETTNQYYVNLISGYKGSHLPAVVELIKLG